MLLVYELKLKMFDSFDGFIKKKIEKDRYTNVNCKDEIVY